MYYEHKPQEESVSTAFSLFCKLPQIARAINIVKFRTYHCIYRAL